LLAAEIEQPKVPLDHQAKVLGIDRNNIDLFRERICVAYDTDNTPIAYKRAIEQGNIAQVGYNGLLQSDLPIAVVQAHNVPTNRYARLVSDKLQIIEILQARATGRTNAEVAETLHPSTTESIIKDRLKASGDMLGLRNRSASAQILVAFAFGFLSLCDIPADERNHSESDMALQETSDMTLQNTEALFLAALGLTNKRIGRQMDTSLPAARESLRVRNTFRKLHIQKREQLAASLILHKALIIRPPET
jgi:DNA-binding NarL/FixJ family response regulator